MMANLIGTRRHRRLGAALFVTAFAASCSTASASALQRPRAVNRGDSIGSTVAETVCPAAGQCVAIGSYTTAAGQTEALIETQSASGWTTIAAPTPSDVDTATAPDPVSALAAVTCSSAGHCLAVGDYRVADEYFGSVDHALIDTDTGGSWTATTVALPSDNTADEANLTTVLCPTTSTCLAGGFYEGTAGTTVSGGDGEVSDYWDGFMRGLVLRYGGGSWQAAGATLRQPDIYDDPDGNLGQATLTCASLDRCGVATSYTNYDTGSLSKLTLGVPRPVAAVAVKLHKATATVSWQASSGRLALSGYTITATDLTDPAVALRTLTSTPKSRSACFASLRRGDRYRFSVAATSLLGNGAAVSTQPVRTR